MLSFLGRMLFQSGIKYVYLWGGMESNDQEMCIRAFQQRPEIKVMVSPRLIYGQGFTFLYKSN